MPGYPSNMIESILRGSDYFQEELNGTAVSSSTRRRSRSGVDTSPLRFECSFATVGLLNAMIA